MCTGSQRRAIFYIFLLFGQEAYIIHVASKPTSRNSSYGHYAINDAESLLIEPHVDHVIRERGLLTDRSSHKKREDMHVDIEPPAKVDPDIWASLKLDSAYAACGFNLLCSLASFVCAIGFGQVSEYTLVASSKLSGVQYALNIAAFLYWVATPATMLVYGFKATCNDGAPNDAYGLYGVFLVAHMGIAGYLSRHLEMPTFFAMSMDCLSILLLLTVLEHFDMATDTLFPGTLHACSSRITPLWLESWRQSALPNFMLPILEDMGFTGFALTLFIGFSYIPQLLVLSPFSTCACGLLSFASAALWIQHSWIIGGVATVSIHAVFAGIMYKLRGNGFFFTNLPDAFHDPAAFAAYSGILVFLLGGAQGKEKTLIRLLMISASKLIFENLLQLWIQSSAFGISFGYFDDEAKQKALISMGLALATSASKMIPLIWQILSLLGETYSQRDGVGFMGFACLGLIPVVCLCLLPWLWIVAKIYFAFSCPSHVWNLSSGCVKL